jgi:putative ABC transport system permease protein
MLGKDFVYASRTLRKSPVFAVTAIATIALGIGASTAIFSVTNAVLLRKLPYKNPDRLVFLCEDMRKRNVKDFPVSNADYIDIRNGTKSSFEDIGAVFTGRGLFPREDGTPEQLRTGVVTTNFFPLIGGKIVAGRDFEEADGEPQPPPPAGGTPAATAPPRLPAIAILSYEYWQRRFGKSPSIIGQRLALAGQPGPLVVGVLAPGFELLFPPDNNIERVPDIWFANRLTYDTANRNQVSLRLIGRLKPGVSLERAQAEVESVAVELRKIEPIHATSGYYLRLEPMHRYIVAEARPAILALMGAVIFLLLIACANVANLLLVRASLRERELAVRTAMGASRGRLMGQVLAEALLLAGIGTLVGLALATLGIRELLLIAPANLPRLESIAIDPAVLGFTALAGLAAAAIFGMAPAIKASRPDIMHVLRGVGRNAGLGGGGLMRNVVVVAEVALSFVLLIGSGLMVRSFIALQNINPGFDPHGLLTFQLLGPRGNQPQLRAAFQQNVKQHLSSMPGVQSVTAAGPFPLTGGFSPIRWGKEDALADSSKFQAVDFQIVLPGYFETMRTPLIAGRTFTDADNAPERTGVVVDEFLATKAFPHESAVGKRVLTRVRGAQPEWVEILGVVAHQRVTSLAQAGREQIYFTDGFVGHGGAGQWAVRTSGDPAQYSAAIRAEIGKLGGRLVINKLTSMDVLVEKAQSGTRFSLLLIGVFAVIAALLAGVGLYGVLSTVVRQRTAEIGVRMALGAAPSSIFQLVVGQGLQLSVVGIALGVAAAFGLTRVMTGMLIGVKPTDPATFAAIAILFLAIAGLASWIPGRRAASLDPTQALRDE